MEQHEQLRQYNRWRRGQEDWSPDDRGPASQTASSTTPRASTNKTAKIKLHRLIQWHIQVATDPAVNGGYQLVPVKPTGAMEHAATNAMLNVPEPHVLKAWRAMLAAAPKPGEME